MRILVTGASGFVGGSFMRRFADCKDIKLFGIGRRQTDFANYARVDLANDIAVPFSPDVVIHLAARASPWGTKADYFRQNVLATQNVVRFCERHSLPRLIYVSSSSVFYRHEHQLNISESSAIGPTFINEYAATKYRGEKEIERYAGKSLILRPRAVFGPGDTVIFPRILRAAREGKFPLFKNAGPPVLGDLIFIDTLCDYLLAAAREPRLEGAYNLTNNQPVVIQDFLLDAFSKLGLPLPKRHVSVGMAMFLGTMTECLYRVLRLAGEPPITRYGVSTFAYSKTFDVTRMLRDLGPPSVSLDEGTRRFIAWQGMQT
jgi:nucleoside-diphosphate-sugar epimerase